LSPLKFVNFKGDLFATTFSFGVQVAIRLCGTIILTRILHPDAYGVITIIMSIVFVVEMLSDINTGLFIVRDKNAEEPRYLNTAWTLQLCRGCINGAILFAVAPWIASSIYHTPSLTLPLRVYSASFIIAGLQSMSFQLAIRHKQSRLYQYSELIAGVSGNIFSVVFCYFSRNYWGMLYGILLNRVLTSILSYAFYRDLRPKLQFDRIAARAILGLSRFTTPSSIITLVITQFDKVVFLRLFDLSLLGVYGIAAGIAGSIEGLISKISQMVLYPRCAHNFRTNPSTCGIRFYTENTKLFLSILLLPAIVGGAAHFAVGVLYPSRYAQAGAILQAFMVRAGILSIAQPAEDLLVAAGEYQVILHGNILRAFWIFPASLAGYYLFGIMGFVYGIALSGLPSLGYYLSLQRKKGMLIWRFELYKVTFMFGVAVLAYFFSGLLPSWSTRKG
jgi:O-antigen/teichoic acid export membrane protein